MKRVLEILFLSIVLFGCNKAGNKNISPAGYDLNQPEKFIMSEALLEISGISFNKGIADTVYAVQDEDGKVFKMNWGQKKAIALKFAKKNDYEDISIMNNIIYVLRSDGAIFSFHKNTLVDKEIFAAEWKQIIPEAEYEGLYADEANGKLYVLCKKCKVDNNKEKVSGYVLDSRNNLQLSSSFSINVTQIKGFTKKLITGFRPSALAKNPLTGQWFILSGSNKLLLIADGDFKIEATYSLNGNTFNQAEGIAFDKDANLYISNEGEEDRNGNILLFKRNTMQNQPVKKD